MKYFKGLTKRQFEVFGQITICNDTGHNPRIIKKLLELGLIEEYQERLLGFSNFICKRYSVPVYWHIRWCEWCSERAKTHPKEFED